MQVRQKKFQKEIWTTVASKQSPKQKETEGQCIRKIAIFQLLKQIYVGGFDIKKKTQIQQLCKELRQI